MVLNEKKSIYIVVSQTGTILSRIIKAITRDEYNHASIALDASLEEMYSFGRMHPYNPVWGGFVKESPDKGTFKRFRKTRMKLIKVEVSAEKYEEVKHILKNMYQHRRRYHYNYIGLATAFFKISYKIENCYYCSEFVKEVLIQSHIAEESDFSEVVKPIDFTSIENGTEVYEGYLRQYVNMPI